MLKLSEIQFEAVEDGALLAVVGQLSITRTGIINRSVLANEGQLRAARTAVSLRIAGQMWTEVYGEIGTIARRLLEAAREGGDLRTIGCAEDLIELLQNTSKQTTPATGFNPSPEKL